MSDPIASPNTSRHLHPQFRDPPASVGDDHPSNDLVEQILREGPLGLSEAARLCGRLNGGKKAHPNTVARWHKFGLRTWDGRVVRLEAIRIDGRRFATSREALLRFIRALQDPSPPPSPVPRNPAQRRHESDAAADELDRLGIR